MSVQKVWRVQNAEGLGPYKGLNHLGPHWETWAECVHTADTGRPDIYDTGLYFQIMDRGCCVEDFIFGFTSLGQLYDWFTDTELEVLREAGFTICRVLATNIIEDGCQCAFQSA